MDDEYAQIINDSTLYPSDFVQKFGVNSAHWIVQSYQQQERSLAHDMICLLLCNMEPVENVIEKMINEYTQDVEREAQKKKQEQSFYFIQAKKPKITCEPDDDDENDDDIPEWTEDNEEEYEEEEEVPIEGIESNFRYILLEGNPMAANIQNEKARQWNIAPRTKIYDILDVIEKRFIEVKFTTNPEKRFYDYAQEEDTDEDCTGLICVSTENGKIEMIHKRDRMRGEAKATGFVLRRKDVLKMKNLRDEAYFESKEISELVFCSSSLNKFLKEFTDCYEGKMNADADQIPGTSKRKKMIGDIEEIKKRDERELKKSTPDIELACFTPESLFEKLTISYQSSDDQEITWDGKMLPSVWKKFIDAEENDVSTIDNIINYIEDEEIIEMTGQGELYNFYKEFVIKWDSTKNEGKNFFIYGTRNKKEMREVPEQIKKSLGIGRKGKINAQAEGMKQPEYHELPKRKYMRWFDRVVSNLAKAHPFPGESTLIFDIEKIDRLEMHREAQQLIQRFNTTVGLSNVGIMISEYQNTFSRLSSSYIAGAKRNGSHSRIVALPFVSNFRKISNGESVRRTTGFMVRGPSHCRNSSDKTNIVTIEIVDDSFLLKFVKNGCLIKLTNNKNILMRQNAFKKIDAPYLAYIRNSLFNPVNLLGELILKKAIEQSRIKVKEQSEEIFLNMQQMAFFVDRVVEGVLMATIGNSRDEGYFSMLRKIIMILISFRRNEPSFSLNINEFCESVNENLVDNPLSMFFHNTVMYVLAVLQVGGRSIN